MSESEPMPREYAEFLVAAAPTGATIILGARGSLARDLAGFASTRPVDFADAWIGGGVDALPAGLWVWSGSLSPGPVDSRWWLRFVATDAAIRPVTLADFPRFGIRTPAPRNPEGAES